MSQVLDSGVVAPSLRKPPPSISHLWHRLTADRVIAVAVAVVVATTGVRLWLSFAVGLGVDESYASTMARDLHLSYVDDPPLHFWIAHYAMAIFGVGRTARIPFVLIGAGTSWLLFLLTRRLFGSRAGLWSLAAYNVIPFFSAISSTWILPDGPLNFLLLGATLQLSKLLAPEREHEPSLRLLVTIGVWIGLAAITKYHALIFSFGALAFVASTPRYRDLLRKPGLYAAMAVAALVNLPTLIWNAENHWASFALQQHRATAGGGIHIGHALLQIAGQFGLLAPWVAVPVAAAVLTSLRQYSNDDRHRLLLFLSVPNILFFTIVPIFGIKGFPHWTMPGWIVALPLLSNYLASKSQAREWPKVWLGVCAAVTVVLVMAAVSEIQNGWLGQRFPAVFRTGDPTVEALEWGQLSSAAAVKAAVRDHLSFVATNWRDGGKIAQALGGDVVPIVLPDDPHGFAFEPNAAGKIGAAAMVVIRQGELNNRLPELRRYFSDLHSVGSIAIGRQDRSEIALELLVARQIRLIQPTH